MTHLGRRTRTSALLGAAALSLTALVGPATAAAPTIAAPVAAPDIPVADVVAQLEEFQAIADANGGNRATGQPGYRASIDHLRAELETAGFVTEVQTFETWRGESYNLIADWPGGDVDNTVMIGGHLDSVEDGPGINDNGSGSAAILEVALAFAESNPEPVNHVRIAFWGAEELGLVGSTHYVDSLDAAATDQIAAYLNFDMLGSPNPGYFVYDDNPDGDALRDALTASFADAGIESEYVDVDGRSDHAAFMAAGIPTAGTFSGAEGTMTTGQAEKWGGEAGTPYDPCYHAACDDQSNIDRTALDIHTDVVAEALWQWSAQPVP